LSFTLGRKRKVGAERPMGRPNRSAQIAVEYDRLMQHNVYLGLHCFFKVSFVSLFIVYIVILKTFLHLRAA